MQAAMRAAAAISLLGVAVSALYIPGIAPTEFRIGQKVPMFVNALNPGTTNDDPIVHSVISYQYYDPRFHFCEPEGGPERQSESLGSILLGDRILSSAYELEFMKNETCRTICKASVPWVDAKFINDRIRENYLVEMLADNLPAASRMSDLVTQTEFDLPGFLLGTAGATLEEYKKPKYHNHYAMYVDYHQIDNEDYRIVGIEVVPVSTRDSACSPDKPLQLEEADGKTTDFEFKLSVQWRRSEVSWATRWDKYLHVYDPKIHWFSLVESFGIVIFLTITVAAILVRTLHKDVQHYNSLDLERDDVTEDSGWKLLHGDVFRPPRYPLMLSILLGNGTQLFLMIGTTIIFAGLGFLSPSNRGSLATASVLLYALYGCVGGFVSAVVYKTIGKAEKYKTLLFLTPTFVPGIVFGTAFLLNFFLISQRASGAVPFGTMLALLGIWALVTLPLSVIGGYIGFKINLPADPVKTNQIPRQVPAQSLYLRSLPSILLSGVLPFGAIFVELYFIVSSWFSRIYYMFGFLFLTYGVFIATTALTTVLMTYLQLCGENYHWWWRSVYTGGAISLYVLVNSAVYFFLKLQVAGFAGAAVYFGYSALLAFATFLVGGTVGFFSSYWFVRKVYSHIKVD